MVSRPGLARYLIAVGLAALLQEAVDVPFEDAARCMADAATAPVHVWSMHFSSQNAASEHYFRLCLRDAKLNPDRRVTAPATSSAPTVRPVSSAVLDARPVAATE